MSGGIDAIVLAGGRGSRLGGRDKARLVLRGRTLLDRALDALAPVAACVAVVGPFGPEDAALGPAAPVRDAVLASGGSVPDARSSSEGPVRDAMPGSGGRSPRQDAAPAPAASVRFALERPRFGGPVPALAAGLRALAAEDRTPAPWVLVLAVDLVHPRAAVGGLLDVFAAGLDGADALVGLDATGRVQPATALYRRAALVARLRSLAADRAGAGAPDGHDDTALAGARLGAVLDGLRVAAVPLAGACADVDTPDDARRHGVALVPHARLAPLATLAPLGAR